MYLSDSYPLLRFVAADSEELVSLGKKTLELKSEFLNFQIVPFEQFYGLYWLFEFCNICRMYFLTVTSVSTPFQPIKLVF